MAEAGDRCAPGGPNSWGGWGSAACRSTHGRTPARRGVGEDERVHVVVVGAGIVGLAAATALGRATPGTTVTVVDKEAGPAHHQSGRNSGVVHSGIYYTPGSHKARLVARGRTLLERFCEEHEVAHVRCGKVVVATTTEEVGRLAALAARAAEGGIEARVLPQRALAEREPWVRCLAALEVPSTGVVDFPGVCTALAREVERAGGGLRLDAEVTGLHEDRTGVVVDVGGGEIRADAAVVCAGVHGDRLALGLGVDTGVRILPFRGEYRSLRGARDHLVRHLVYPLPDPSFPFLGVHLTRGVDGHVHVGPNAVPALGREAYSWGQPSWSETWEIARRPGTWRLARRYWRTGLEEIHRSLDDAALLRAVQRLVPEVAPGDLVAAPAGIRAQAVDRRGHLLDDFAFTETRRCTVVVNAPSPAATASLAIGEEIAERLLARLV